MAHLTSIGAGMFSDLAVAKPATPLTTSGLAALDTAAEFQALFTTEIDNIGGTPAAGTFVRIKNVREFPPIGTPPNVVKVAVYGQKSNQQIQGQADSPTMELTLNLVSADWADDATAVLGSMVGDGNQYVFRFALMNNQPTGYASTALSIGTAENSQWYWIGKVEAFEVTPQLTDANTAKVTLTMQSDLYGPYTI